MYYWLFISISILLVPLLMLIMGLMCWFCPPKSVCWFFGYRSRRATASDEVWLYAQNLLGKIWTISGSVLLIAAFILSIVLLKRDDVYRSLAALITLGAEIFTLVCIIIPVEIVLYVRFDRFGNARQKEDNAQRPRRERRTAEPETYGTLGEVTQELFELDPAEAENWETAEAFETNPDWAQEEDFFPQPPEEL